MSNQAITAVTNRVVPGGATAKFVLLCMADHAGRETWTCFPSTERLAAETQLSVRTVGSVIRGLEAAGLIHRERRMDGRRRLSDLIVLHRDSILDLPLHQFHDALAGRDGKGSKVSEQEEADQEPSKQEPAIHRARNRQSTVNPADCSTYREPEVEPTPGAAVAVAGDTIKDQAHRLAQISFEQNPKPVCRGGFVAVMGLFKSFIKAGHRPEDLERAIRSGVFTTWTLAAMTVALDRATAKPKPPRSERTLADKSAQYERVLNRLGAAS